MAAITNDVFVHRCRLLHGDKYDYSLTSYTKMHGKVTILCPIHGAFEQKAYSHVQGKGCKACSYEDRAGNSLLSYEDILHRFREVHGDRYDYSRMKYEGTKVKTHIICRRHGSFWQEPQNHMRGANCPTCAEIERVHIEGPVVLYYARIDAPSGTYWKIGVTGNGSAKNRFKGVLTEVKVTILMEQTYDICTDAFEVEQQVLRDYDAVRIIAPELGGGRTECFSENVLGL